MKFCVDIGNSRIKAGLVAGGAVEPFTPRVTVSLADKTRAWSQLDSWLDALSLDALSLEDGPPTCWVASVHGAICREFVERMQARDDVAQTHTLVWQDFPIKVGVEHPGKVGVDRLAAALAARHLVGGKQAVIVIDLGTAITIDRVSAVGEFEGGAILPGIELSAKALHTSTDALPQVTWTHDSRSATLPGKSTEAAIEAGLHWAVVGSIHEIVGRLSEDQNPQPAVFFTGGAAEAFAPKLDFVVQHETDLVLQGIALAAEGQVPDTDLLSS